MSDTTETIAIIFGACVVMITGLGIGIWAGRREARRSFLDWLFNTAKVAANLAREYPHLPAKREAAEDLAKLLRDLAERAEGEL